MDPRLTCTDIAYIRVMRNHGASAAAPNTAEHKITIMLVAPSGTERPLEKNIEFASAFVIDSVGRNNFTNTLDDGRALDTYAAGAYVIKYADDSRNRINVHYIHLYAGVFTSTVAPELIGWFECVPVMECLPAVQARQAIRGTAEAKEVIADLRAKLHRAELDLRAAREEMFMPHRAPKPSAKLSQSFDGVIGELSKFDRSNLRRVYNEANWPNLVWGGSSE